MSSAVKCQKYRHFFPSSPICISSNRLESFLPDILFLNGNFILTMPTNPQGLLNFPKITILPPPSPYYYQLFIHVLALFEDPSPFALWNVCPNPPEGPSPALLHHTFNPATRPDNAGGGTCASFATTGLILNMSQPDSSNKSHGRRDVTFCFVSNLLSMRGHNILISQHRRLLFFFVQHVIIS